MYVHTSSSTGISRLCSTSLFIYGLLGQICYTLYESLRVHINVLIPLCPGNLYLKQQTIAASQNFWETSATSYVFPARFKGTVHSRTLVLIYLPNAVGSRVWKVHKNISMRTCNRYIPQCLLAFQNFASHKTEKALLKLILSSDFKTNLQKLQNCFVV